MPIQESMRTAYEHTYRGMPDPQSRANFLQIQLGSTAITIADAEWLFSLVSEPMRSLDAVIQPGDLRTCGAQPNNCYTCRLLPLPALVIRRHREAQFERSARAVSPPPLAQTYIVGDSIRDDSSSFTLSSGSNTFLSPNPYIQTWDQGYVVPNPVSSIPEPLYNVAYCRDCACSHSNCLCTTVAGCDDCSCEFIPCDSCNCPCYEYCHCNDSSCDRCGCTQVECDNCNCTCYDCPCDYERCRNCNCGERRNRELIRGYSFNPLQVLEFQYGKNEKLNQPAITYEPTVFYGVELETNTPDNSSKKTRCATEALDRLGTDFAILKEDGSVNPGFEIVTAPATMQAHKERWLPFFENRPKGLNSWDSGQCGMHIHISRPSPYIIGKMLVFMNDSDHLSEIEKIAGRESGHWAEFRPKTLHNAPKRRNPFNGARYEALNVTKPGTVEMRIFKGTLDPQKFMKNIEFAAATQQFCKEVSFDFRNTGRPAKPTLWKEYVTFVNSYKYLYPVLDAFLQGKTERRKVWSNPYLNRVDMLKAKKNKKEEVVVCV